MSFLHISDDVLLELVTEWLSSDSVCKLDSAFSSRISRQHFLDLISNEKVLLNDIGHFQPNNASLTVFLLMYWGWCEKRNVGLKTISISTLVVSDLLGNKSIEKELNRITYHCNKAIKDLFRCIPEFSSYDKNAIPNSFIFSKEFSELQSFYYDGKFVTDGFLHVLAASCKRFQSVRFIDCDLITDAGFIAILKANPQIWEIECQLCPLVTGLTAQYAAKHCLKLQSITFGAQDDMPLWDFIINCPQLRTLNALLGADESVSTNTLNRILSSNMELNLTALSVNGIPPDLSEHFLKVLTKCKQLRSLGMDKMTLSDALLHTLADNCPALSFVSFSDCKLDGGTDALYNIFRQHSIITHVCLHNCDFINDVVMSKIVSMLPYLVHLFVTSMQISDATLEAVAKHCKTLDSFLIPYCPAVTAGGVIRLLTNKRAPLGDFLVSTVLFPNKVDHEMLQEEYKKIGTNLTLR